MSGSDRNEPTTHRKFGAETVLSVPFLWPPFVSPSGERVAWFSDETGRPELWAADLPTQDTWQVTNRDLASAVGTYDLSWIDDDFLFARTPGQHGKRSVSIFSVNDGDLQRTLPHDLPHGDLAATADGRYLITGWNEGLYRIDLLTDEQKRLVNWAQPSSIQISSSQDWLAFNASPDLSQRPQPCCCKIDGSDFTNIASDTDAGDQLRFVAWHPSTGRMLIQDMANSHLNEYTIGGDSLNCIGTVQPGEQAVGYSTDEIVIRKGSDTLKLQSRVDNSKPLIQDVKISWVTTAGREIFLTTEARSNAPPRLLHIDETGAAQSLHVTEYGPVGASDRTPETFEYPATNDTNGEVRVFKARGESAPVVSVVYSPGNAITDFPIAGSEGVAYFVRQGYTVVLASTPSERLSEAAKDDHVTLGEWLCNQ